MSSATVSEGKVLWSDVPGVSREEGNGWLLCKCVECGEHLDFADPGDPESIDGMRTTFYLHMETKHGVEYVLDADGRLIAPEVDEPEPVVAEPVLMACPHAGCKKTYKTRKGLQKHLATKHEVELVAVDEPEPVAAPAPVAEPAVTEEEQQPENMSIADLLAEIKKELNIEAIRAEVESDRTFFETIRAYEDELEAINDVLPQMAEFAQLGYRVEQYERLRDLAANLTMAILAEKARTSYKRGARALTVLEQQEAAEQEALARQANEFNAKARNELAAQAQQAFDRQVLYFEKIKTGIVRVQSSKGPIHILEDISWAANNAVVQAYRDGEPNKVFGIVRGVALKRLGRLGFDKVSVKMVGPKMGEDGKIDKKFQWTETVALPVDDWAVMLTKAVVTMRDMWRAERDLRGKEAPAPEYEEVIHTDEFAALHWHVMPQGEFDEAVDVRDRNRKRNWTKKEDEGYSWSEEARDKLEALKMRVEQASR